MNLEFTRETCFDPSTSVLVTGGSLFGSGTLNSEIESVYTVSKEAAADCLYEEVSSAHENSRSDWMIPFTALQAELSAKELTSCMSSRVYSSLHLQLEDDEHCMEPVSCTDVNTPTTFFVHYSVEETDPTSSHREWSFLVPNTHTTVHSVFTTHWYKHAR